MSRREPPEQRIDEYLDGALDPVQTAAFERELVKPKVARALREAMARRDVLGRDPGDAPPAPGTARIEQGERRPGRRSAATAALPARSRRPSALKAALHGASWIVRGPAMAFTSPGSRGALAGLASVRYTLGPLLAHRPPARAAASTIADNRPVRAASSAVELAGKARDFTRRNPWLQLALRRLLR